MKKIGSGKARRQSAIHRDAVRTPVPCSNVRSGRERWPGICAAMAGIGEVLFECGGLTLRLIMS